MPSGGRQSARRGSADEPSCCAESLSRAESRAAMRPCTQHVCGLAEWTSTKIRVMTGATFGHPSPEALIALAILSLGGHSPQLPVRTARG